ncbi:hypothetical protein F2P56_034549 [Juglans regia]|uniref:Uncharacterized protein n=1 Tax=Juglans regia TaxID=51240 RepID=A0A833TE82_JUGRE|nr:hypothetical protein F2P56_034549 [Juglans regia]
MTLPASLTRLCISKFSNLECLCLRNLTSLETLQISYCKKLKCFSEDALPPSLQRLLINKCPLLEERYKKDQRGEWRRIADIPCVKINGVYIYDTKTEEDETETEEYETETEEDPKLRPTFAEIMAALKPLQKPIASSQVPRPSKSTGSGRQRASPSQTAEEAS